jgi:hypothetical protein
MARKFVKPRKHETGRSISTKTPYGVTSEMVVTEEDILKKVKVGDSQVLVRDDFGYFFVEKKAIDSGLACPIRYSEKREQIHNSIMEEINANKEV